MTYSIIDIGSNSMRLTVYEVENKNFKILFREKIMAGLAGYVDKGILSNEGITRACDALLEFKGNLAHLGITENIYVFATASLRNITNTEDAASEISSVTGFPIDIISGNEEAEYGYIGAAYECGIEDGAFVDIGGASTEINILKDKELLYSHSWHIGSLKLYKECVSKIIPGSDSIKRIQEAIYCQMPVKTLERFSPAKKLVCIGGTARSVLKTAKHLNMLSKEEHTFSSVKLKQLGKVLTENKRTAADIILKVDPERIHTMIPGYMILQYLTDSLDADELIISRYGVREGYLCKKVLL